MKAIEAAAALFIRAALLGMDHATRKKEFADNDGLTALPFEEAVHYMGKKLSMPAHKYYALSDRLKFRAFTVSRLNDGDAIMRVKRIIRDNLENGEGLKGFLKRTDAEILKSAGFAKDGAYWEAVYRTNVQTAYNAGRAMGFEEEKPIALELVGVGDARQTDICKSLTQPSVRRAYNDPFWKTHWPPFHFNCRTTVRAIYDEEELKEEPLTVQPRKTGTPPKGWGRYPVGNDAWWDELKSQVKRAKAYGIQGEIEEARKRLIQSGARSKIINELLSKDIIEQEKLVIAYYEEKRAGDNSKMIQRIADNTGKPYKEVEDVFNHIFIYKHRFRNGQVKRFDPDSSIIIELERLATGEYTDVDMLFLNHEISELTYMRNKKYSVYETAHGLANKKYNWEMRAKNEDIQKKI